MTHQRFLRCIADAHNLCRTIAAQDLANHPLYILPQSGITARMGRANGCFGYTSGTLDLLLRDEIGDAWQGRGPCIVVNDELMLSEFGEESLAADINGIVLHELAHVLSREQLVTPWENPQPEHLRSHAQQVANHVAADKGPPRVPWTGHELPFIRAFLHLTWRAEQTGQRILTAAFCAGPICGLSSALTYQRTLGDEPANLADLPIRAILKEPLPREFLHLYINDLGRWDREQHLSNQGA